MNSTAISSVLFLNQNRVTLLIKYVVFINIIFIASLPIGDSIKLPLTFYLLVISSPPSATKVSVIGGVGVQFAVICRRWELGVIQCGTKSEA